MKVNGKLTLGENTADNGGLRLAYMAFLADAKRKNIDLHAKHANGYTPVQQFFLAYGQNWCGSIRPEQVRLQVQTDPHSPRQFRVNGVVQNMPEIRAGLRLQGRPADDASQHLPRLVAAARRAIRGFAAECWSGDTPNLRVPVGHSLFLALRNCASASLKRGNS